MKRMCWIALILLVLSACGGGKSVPDSGEIYVPTVVPTFTPTPEPTATPQPNILEVVSAMAEAKARVEAEVGAEGMVRMTAEQFQAWQAEANRHTEMVQQQSTQPLRDVAVAFAAAEAVDDATRNTGVAAALGLTLFLIVGFFVLARSLSKGEEKEGGG